MLKLPVLDFKRLLSLTLSVTVVAQLSAQSIAYAADDDIDIEPINMPKVNDSASKNDKSNNKGSGSFFPIPEEEDLVLPDILTPGDSSSNSGNSNSGNNNSGSDYPRKNYNNPRNNYGGGYSNYPDYSNNTPSIGNIDVSMVSGVTCPLVDNQPREDLLAAAENLSMNIAPLKQCRTSDGKDASDSAEVGAMQNYLDNLIKSGKIVQEYIKHPELVTADKSKLNEIQSEINSIIRGVDQVSQALMRNSLMNGECAKKMMKFTDVIVSLSDLVQAATPYAIKVLETNPAFTPAIPYVIGLSAAGNVVKVIKRLNDDRTLNMDDERTRSAVKQSICEYNRIVQRIRTFNAAKRGDLKEATTVLGKYSTFSKKVFKKYSHRAQEIVTQAAEVKKDLNEVKRSAMNDQSEISNLYSEILTEKNNKLACYIARDLVKRSGNNEELPTRAIVNIKQALKNQTFVTDSAKIIHSAMLSAEEALRKKLIKETQLDNEQALNQCAADGKAYIDALNRLAGSTQNLASSMQFNVNDTVLNDEDPEVRALAHEQTSIEQEENIVQILTDSAVRLSSKNKKSNIANKMVTNKNGKTHNAINAQLLETLNKDNGVLVDAEINRNLMEVKSALFGKRFGWLGTGFGAGKSPAYAWYADTDVLVRKNATVFENQVISFRNQTSKLTWNMVKDMKTKNFEGKMTKASEPQKNIAYARAHSQLAGLNIQNIEKMGVDREQVCRKMNDLLDLWQGTLDHYGSLLFFCSYLRDSIDSTFDDGIIKSCVGKVEVNDSSTNTASELSKLRVRLQGNAQQAALIQSKFEELQCE